MGLRFKKSFKIAPGIKLNLNKKSTSITFGGKGVHYTVNSRGKRTSSIGLPGTGVYYTTSTNKKKRTNDKPKTNANSNNISRLKEDINSVNIPRLIGIAIFGILFYVSVVFEASSSPDGNIPVKTITTTPIPTVVSDTTNIEYSNNTAAIQEKLQTMYTTTDLNVRSGPGTTYDILAVLTKGSEVSVIDLDFDEKWAEIEYKNQKAYISTKYLTSTNENASPTKTQTEQQVMVWIPYKGSKYHSNPSCSNMKGPSKVSIEDAIKLGYTRCKKCY